MNFKNNVTTAQIDAQITKAHREFRNAAMLKGTQDGISNFPSGGSTSLQPLIAGIHSAYSSLNAQVIQQLDPKLLIQLGAIQKEDSTKELIGTRKKIAELQSENDLRKRDYGQKSFFWPMLAFVFGVAFSASIVGAEWRYISSSLQVLVEDYATCLMISLGISATLVAISHLLHPYLVMKNVSSKWKRIIMGTAIALVIGLFILLGFFRSKFMKEMYDVDCSPWIFVLITTSLFLGLFLSSEMILKPTYTEVKEAFIVLANQFRILRTKMKIRSLERKVKNIDRGTSISLVDKLSLISQAKNFEEQIENYYHETVSAYIGANLKHRTDTIVPSVFSQQPPAIKKYTNDINI